MGNSRDGLCHIARWTGLLASTLVFALGVVHVLDSRAKLRWPRGKFTADVNMWIWRNALFTFKPDQFADHWTPCFMGGLGILWHFENLEWTRVMCSFLRYFLWLFLTAMFGCIGYNGGLGIVFSAFVFLAALLSLLAFLLEDANASLRLDKRLKSNAGGR